MVEVISCTDISLCDIDGLIPYVNNARTHSDEQVSQIAASIKEFGFTNPILIGDDDGIIAGHGRLLAARKLGIKQVPCIRLSHLSEAQRRAYVLADNKLAMNAGWDEELLSLELGELDNIGFDLQLTGFSENELSQLLLSDDMETGSGEGEGDGEESLPEPVSSQGDVWVLSHSRFECGGTRDRSELLACDEVVRGWQEFTGGIAKLEKTGSTFNELAVRRADR